MSAPAGGVSEGSPATVTSTATTSTGAGDPNQTAFVKVEEVFHFNKAPEGTVPRSKLQQVQIVYHGSRTDVENEQVTRNIRNNVLGFVAFVALSLLLRSSSSKS